MKTKPNLTRLLPLLSLVAVSVASAGTVQLVVPTYDYTLDKASNTEGYGISNKGTAVGNYNHKATYGSFTRSQKGRFSRPILFPGARTTEALGVNSSGLVCGSYTVGIINHGFFFDGTTYTTFDLPGSDNTVVTGVNDAGDFCGYGASSAGFHIGFVSIGGVVTTFGGPTGASISPSGLNNLGQVVGYYGTPSFGEGFFRAADGTLTYPIAYPVADFTTLTGINDAGLIVGWYQDVANATYGLVVQDFTRFTSYAHPDAANDFTFFNGVNNNNLINGYYQVDGFGSSNHAFIARFGR